MSECIRLSASDERDWDTGTRSVIRRDMQAYADEHDVDVEMCTEDGRVLDVFTPWDGK